MEQLKCGVCDRTYLVQRYRAKTSKQCSRLCHNRAVAPRGPMSDEQKQKIAKAHMGMKKPWTAERNKKYRLHGAEITTWKGDDVGYIAIHNWAHRHVKLKEKCELCGSPEKLEMANKSQQYKRELDDWRTLCMPCHRSHDAEFRRNGGVSRKLHRWKAKPAD